MALRLAEEMLKLGHIEHVSGKTQIKDDEYDFFRFSRRIVIVGGGFCGSYVLKKLEKYFDHITLVDRRPFFECVLSLPNLIVDPTYAERIRSKHENYVKKARLVISGVKQVSKNELLLENGDRLEFDYLVLSTGSSYNMRLITSLAEEGIDIINCTSSEEMLRAYEKTISLDDLTVIGGGPVGIEICGELMVGEMNLFGTKRSETKRN